MRKDSSTALLAGLNLYLLVAIVVLAGLITGPVQAGLISGWGLETGGQNATLTEGAPGSFSTTTPTGDARARASLPSPITFNVGDQVLLSGTVTIQNSPGNQQFRWGLFDSTGHATGTLSSGLWTGSDPNGWRGYLTRLGGTATGSDQVVGRDTTANGWHASAGQYIVGQTGVTSSVPAATPYNFSLLLTRTSATTVQTDYSFVGGTVSRSGSFVDNGGASSGIPSFNAVGFLLNANTGAGTFTNVSVDQVPEPAALLSAVMGIAMMLPLGRRRPSN
jgi:hypothetical protein